MSDLCCATGWNRNPIQTRWKYRNVQTHTYKYTYIFCRRRRLRSIAIHGPGDPDSNLTWWRLRHLFQSIHGYVFVTIRRVVGCGLQQYYYRYFLLLLHCIFCGRRKEQYILLYRAQRAENMLTSYIRHARIAAR